MVLDPKQPAKTLDEYLDKWRLHSPLELSKTPTSHVYKVSHGSEVAVLKLLTEVGRADESYAPVALRNFDGYGAVRIFDSDEFAHLLEYVDGDDLTRVVINGRDSEATKIICAILNKLHKAKPREVLPSLHERFSSLHARVHSGRSKNAVLDHLCLTASPILEALLATGDEKVVLHGDMHHENVLHDKVRGWISIDPKGLYGDRAYDVANIFLNPHGLDDLILSEARVSNLADIIVNEMNLDRARILKYAYVHACLSACWSVEDGQSPDRAIRTALLIRDRFADSIGK